MSDPREIAKGLTKAQRDIVLSDTLPHVVSLGDLKALRELELTDRAVSRKTGWKVPLTDLGLAVRAALEEGA